MGLWSTVMQTLHYHTCEYRCRSRRFTGVAVQLLHHFPQETNTEKHPYTEDNAPCSEVLPGLKLFQVEQLVGDQSEVTVPITRML